EATRGEIQRRPQDEEEIARNTASFLPPSTLARVTVQKAVRPRRLESLVDKEEPGTTSVSETKTGADITTISVWTLDKIKEDAVARLPSKFDSVAAESFESCTNSEADLILKPEASPVQMKRFNIVTQFAKTDKDVRHQEDDVNNVNNSHWAAPKVVVKKKKVHNFSNNFNDSLWLHQQQRSSSEDDFNKLIGGQLKQFDYINEFIRLRDVGSTVPGISEIFDSKISAQGATSNADYNVYGRSTNEDRHSMEAPWYHNSFRAHLSMCNTSLLPDAWYIRQLDKDERLDPELGHSKRMPPPLNYDGSQLIKLTDSTIIDDAVAAKDNRSRTSPAASRATLPFFCAKELPASYLLNNVKPNMVHAVTADSIDSIGRHRAASLRRHPRETCKQTCRQRHGFNSAKKINTCKKNTAIAETTTPPQTSPTRRLRLCSSRAQDAQHTFLTCISISAVATNGVVESGGAYFMISRNLGPEFGSAVGILFYLANTVATSMYLVGGVEIFLLYMFPWLTLGGKEGIHDTSPTGSMTNSLRLYGTILLLIEFAIVAMGVKFVQMLAPVSLFCVIASILACYAGGIEKTLNPGAGQYVCLYGERLLQSKAFLPENVEMSKVCSYCSMNNTMLIDLLCDPKLGPGCMGEHQPVDSMFRCINGFPGFDGHTLLDNFGSNYVDKEHAAIGVPANTQTDVYQDVKTSFFLLLAIYFPAVTGIFTGANMSGDLKNPQASIPKGTIAANLTTSFIYFSLAFVFGGAINGYVLRDKNGQSVNSEMIVALLSWPSPWVLIIGSFLSTFGAALQCLCSAPRLLQAIAKDEVIPILTPFKKVTAKNEPFLGLVLTTLIAELAILMGNMDTIAAVVDFFFLMCYAFVNLICALHSLLGAPNWRPRFKYYHWFLSLLGAVLCFFIMFSTHWDYALVACFLCLIIYKYVEWKGAKKEWGDGIRGLALTTAQYSLMKIEDKAPHPKNWRPQLLLLLSMSWSKEVIDVRYLNLLNLASQLKAGKGLTVVTAFVKGDPTSPDDKRKCEQVKGRIDFDMNQVRLRGFAKTLVHAEDQIFGSMSTLVQSVGLGGLKPNTMLISWPVHDREEDMTEYNTFIEKVHAACVNDMAIVVAKGIIDFPSHVFRMNGVIDVYWIVHDGGLCLLMGFLLKQHKPRRTQENARAVSYCGPTAVEAMAARSSGKAADWGARGYEGCEPANKFLVETEILELGEQKVMGKHVEGFEKIDIYYVYVITKS
ncbi:unnamed protein product, partial [Caenorhabditis auriculariae]